MSVSTLFAVLIVCQSALVNFGSWAVKESSQPRFIILYTYIAYSSNHRRVKLILSLSLLVVVVKTGVFII